MTGGTAGCEAARDQSQIAVNCVSCVDCVGMFHDLFNFQLGVYFSPGMRWLQSPRPHDGPLNQRGMAGGVTVAVPITANAEEGAAKLLLITLCSTAHLLFPPPFISANTAYTRGGVTKSTRRSLTAKISNQKGSGVILNFNEAWHASSSAYIHVLLALVVPAHRTPPEFENW